MVVKIAVFGSKDFIHHIKKYEKDISNIELIPYSYNHPRESLQLIQQAAYCDVFYFSGFLPYFFSKVELDKLDAPVVYAGLDEISLSLSLFYIQHHYHIPISRIAIDLTDKKDVYNVLNYVDIPAEPLHIKNYQGILEDDASSFDLEEIIQFHTNLWHAGEVEIVLTSIHAVYDRLTEQGINCMKMIESEKQIADSLIKAKTAGKLQKSESSQIAVGLISINDYDRLVENVPVVYQQEYVTKIRQPLDQFARKINASVQHLQKDRFVIYGTKGGIEFITEHFQSMPLLSEVENNMQTSISAGFGFGLTTKEAENHAAIALNEAKALTNSSAFIVTEDKKVIGPLNENKKYHRLKTENHQLQTLAKTLHLSTTNVDKVIQFIKSRNSHRFTSYDLSEYLAVSRRTSERILKKFSDHHYLQIVGEEKTYQKGRPRAIYEINLPIDQFS
ncbi:GTP cyclohydrolase IIa [Halobacillus hunanensis]|uniref:GTP cyclohydrolase IIa n=1 Tax=Halobacillus hunanensis TaxID=578214 RepID=UPI0009A83678|nr:GTP cyclohydrolase IIa [Halobacillus hunanensis]